MKDLLCTTDLTTASDAALLHALGLADRLGARVSLLHVLGKGERSEEQRAEVRRAMDGQVTKAGGSERVRVLLIEGDFMEEIVKESANGHGLLVMGTHGPQGLRQSLFGADVLKIVRRASAPSFVVQAGSRIENMLARIVLPVAAHAAINKILDPVCALARAYASEVHVYQVMRPGEEPSKELLQNKLTMFERLDEEGIRRVEANVPQSGFSVGFAGSTIEYARSIGAGAIAIMSHASEEYRYIADAEKERILANEAFIPVICG